jgi:hypothetical protein
MIMRRFFYENGLLLTMFGLFLFFLAGQSVAGWLVYNADQEEHQQPAIPYSAYLQSGHFLEAVFENWESEFLQMGAYVILTVLLRQKGSPESRPLDTKGTREDSVAAARRRANSPWAARQHGWIGKLYEYSLTLALFFLFILSFILHAVGGQHVFTEEQALHGGHPVTISGYVMTSQFWFESFQNWQSEFLSVGVLILLSIFLRQKGSPQSKPVSHPHGETGDE